MYACFPARRTFIQRPVTVGNFEKLGEVYTTTEDGSMGEKGYVTQHSVLHTDRFDMIYTCGPKPMMVSVAKYAKAHGIECEVSLEIGWLVVSVHAYAVWRTRTKGICVFVKRVLYLI